MSLVDRINHENGKLSTTEFLMKTCFHCKFWSHFVKRDYSYCHRCVNNLRIPIKNQGRGISIDGLYDYYNPSTSPKTKTGLAR